MDPDGLTLACATRAEELAAIRGGARSTALVGLAATMAIPPGLLVSFGLAGALRDDLPCGTVIDATRIVDEEGEVLWEGGLLGVPGARPGTILSSRAVVDDPAERRRFGDRARADVADLESGPLALTGRLAGCLRVVSDTPRRRLHGLARTVGAEGKVAWPSLAGAFLRAPVGSSRAALDARRALRVLERVAGAIP